MVAIKQLQKRLLGLQGQMQAGRFISITHAFSSCWHSIPNHCQEHVLWRLVMSTWSCERSFRANALGRAAPSSSDPGDFSSLSVDQLSSLPAFPFMFAVRVGADCI